MCVIQNTVPPVGAANLESQLSMAVSLASTTLESVNRLTGLNVNLARATLEHSNLVVRQLMSAEDRDQLMSVVSAQAQPNTRRSFDYAYYLTTIVTSAQMDFIHILGEGVADTNRNVISLVKGAAMEPLPNTQKRVEVDSPSSHQQPQSALNVIVNERARGDGDGPTKMH
jgi:phasin family protein